MRDRKSKWISIRCTEVLFRKLLAICAVSGKSRTVIIEDLINAEYEKNKKYSAQYYADLDKGV